ncbi:MAG: NUDIX domain-containing protein, partial [Bacilli bacterium]|nr:NUDIX domain-containing protein [Bacilli bacterium]
KREIKEETGLEIVNLEICGIKDWYDYDKEERQLIFLFTTSEFSGDLLPETDEGKNYWIEEEKIIDLEIAEDFEKLLEVFNDKNKNEMIYIEKNNEWYVELY